MSIFEEFFKMEKYCFFVLGFDFIRMFVIRVLSINFIFDDYFDCVKVW